MFSVPDDGRRSLTEMSNSIKNILKSSKFPYFLASFKGAEISLEFFIHSLCDIVVVEIKKQKRKHFAVKERACHLVQPRA